MGKISVETLQFGIPFQAERGRLFVHKVIIDDSSLRIAANIARLAELLKPRAARPESEGNL